MALQIISTDITTPYYIDFNDTVVLLEGVSILNPTSSGIETIGSYARTSATVLGTIITATNGLNFYSDGSGGDVGLGAHSAYVGRSGYIQSINDGSAAIFMRYTYNIATNYGELFGYYGVQLLGSSFGTVYNYGDITGRNSGVALLNSGSSDIFNLGQLTARGFGVFMDSSDFSTFYNSGSLISQNTGVYMGFSDGVVITNSGSIIGDLYGIQSVGGSVMLNNSGSLTGGVYGIFVISPSGGSSIINSGTITAGATAIKLSGANDVVKNSGILEGDVKLGGGDDTYIGRQFGVTNGLIDGEAGNDFLKGSKADDQIEGGADNDKLFGRGGDDILSGGTGADQLSGGRGDDILSGGAQKDQLNGNRGNDVLKGGGGSDRLNGGLDDDRLTGNGGSDLFIFARKAGDDRITDFTNGSDQIDLTAFGLTGFADLTGATQNLTGGTLIDLNALGGVGSIFLQGFALADLDASDFIF